jgi:hypothetical protein
MEIFAKPSVWLYLLGLALLVTGVIRHNAALRMFNWEALDIDGPNYIGGLHKNLAQGLMTILLVGGVFRFEWWIPLAALAISTILGILINIFFRIFIPMFNKTMMYAGASMGFAGSAMFS